MYFIKSAAFTLTALSLCVLAGCGGGSKDAPAPLADSTLSGTPDTPGAFPAGPYVLDTTYDNASGVTEIEVQTGVAEINVQTIEWVRPEDEKIHGDFFFFQSDPQKFSVTLNNQANGAQYSCRSNAWTKEDLAAIKTAVFEDTELFTNRPICPAGVTIDAEKHAIALTNVLIPLESPAPNAKSTATVTLNFSWELPPAPTDGSSGIIPPMFGMEQTLVVSAAGTYLPTGTYYLDTAYTNASGTDTTTSGAVIEFVKPESANFSARFYFNRSDTSKFAVGIKGKDDTDTKDKDEGAAAYFCVSQAWTPADLVELEKLYSDSTLQSSPKCPSSISIDVTNHKILFTDLKIPSTNDLTQSLTTSAKFDWKP